MQVGDFNGRIKAAMSAGMSHESALVFLQMQQKERHHMALMKKLDAIEDWVRSIREGRGPFYS